jgi:NADP-dependent aldehyde dehydrogenase
MIHQKILCNGKWQEANFPVSSFKAVYPREARQGEMSFPISSFLDIDEMLQSAEIAKFQVENCSLEKRATFLRLISEKINKHSDEICQITSQETGFEKNKRLMQVELPKMLAQINMAADSCMNLEWMEPTIDSEREIRSIRGALDGPIILFGSTCFPFLMNSCGGNDFVSAICAGNTVIAKGNPNHPQTSLKLAELIFEAVKESEMPEQIFQFFHHTTPDLGYRLASHPMIGAFSFSGSRQSGLALKESADRAGNLFFGQLSGMNPVFLLAEAVNENSNTIAADLLEAILFSSGQYYTKPGICFVSESENTRSIINSLKEKLENADKQYMLNDQIARDLDTVLSNFIRIGAKKVTRSLFHPAEPFIFPGTIVEIDARTFLKFSRHFQEITFGPVLVFVITDEDSQFKDAIKVLEGSPSISIYTSSGDEDKQTCKEISAPILRLTGRLLHNQMPTDISLSSAAIYGGPFPASNNPGFSAIGFPSSIKRFTSLKCYTNVSEEWLPEVLKNKNPDGNCFRLINGKLSKENL